MGKTASKKAPRADRKKPRVPSAAMQMEAVHLVDEYFAKFIKDHGVGFWDTPDDGRVRGGLQTDRGRRTGDFAKAFHGRGLEMAFRWLSMRNLAELKKANGWTYIEVCLDRRGLGDRDVVR